MRVVQAGDLLVTSGSIVACDPYWLNTAPQAYTTRVPLGRSPVFVSIAEFESNHDRRVACAKLCFNEQVAVRWEMAVWPGQDVSTLEAGQHFCYGVDAGTGCFVDLDVVEWLFDQAGVRDLEKWRGLPNSMADTPDEGRKLVDRVYDYFEKSVDTRLYGTWESKEPTASIVTGYPPQHAFITLNDVMGGNLVMFSSGWGDGCYGSYFGYAADGVLACLITDFGVLSNARPRDGL